MWWVACLVADELSVHNNVIIVQSPSLLVDFKINECWVPRYQPSNTVPQTSEAVMESS